METTAPDGSSTLRLFGRPAIAGRELTGTLAPTLLSLLAVRAKEWVESDVLIDQLYGDEVPATARNSLQNQVSLLRSIIEDGRAGCAIETLDRSYRLSIEPRDVDLTRLEHAVADRDRAELELLRPHWRMQPFAGCRPSPALDARRLHLARVVTDAVVNWASGADDAAEEIEWALSEDPYAERLWELLIRAHLDNGRRGDAAAVVERARDVFEDELGTIVPPVLRELLGAERAGARTIDTDEHQLIGRETELTHIAARRAAAAAGSGSLLLLTGPAGIGKTTLIRAAAEAARREGFRVGRGQAWADEQVPPYWLWREALLAAAGAEAVPQLPRHPSPREVAELPAVVAAAVIEVAQELGPLFLVLDDVHQADRESVRVLQLLSERLDGVPLALIVAARAGVAWEPDVEAALRRQVDVAALDVAPWTDAELETYAQRRLGATVHPQMVEHLRRHAGGNPFATDRVLSTDADDVATDLVELIAEHISQLRPDLRELVEVVSLAGSDTEFGLVATVLNRTPAATAALVRAGIGAGLVELTGDTIGPRHATVTDAVAQTLSAPDLQSHHDRIAEVLAAAESTELSAVIRLAHHATLALGPGESSARAVAAAEAAGDASLSAAGPREAAHWFQRARELAERGDGAPVVRLLVAEGRALGIAGLDQPALAALHRAAERVVSDADAGAAAAVAIELLRQRTRMIHRPYRSDPRLVATAELALAAKPPPATTAMLHAALSADAISERAYERGLANAEAALGAASIADDAEAEVRALVAQRLALATQPERAAEWVALTLRAEERVGAVGDEALEERIAALHLTDAITTADPAMLAAHALRHPAAAERSVGHSGARAIAANAQVASAQGRYDDARVALGALSDALGDAADLESLVVGFYAELALGLDQGYTPELVQRAELGAAARPLLASRVGLAQIYADVGRNDDARRVLVEACSPDPAALPRDDSWLFAMALAAHTTWRIDEPRFAASLHGLLRPFSDLCAVPGTGPMPFFGAVALHAGAAGIVAGELEDADELLDQADEIHERLGITPWLLRSRLARATLLQRRRGPGDAERATAVLRAVRSDAQTLGATAIEDHADTLLSSQAAAG